MTPIKTSGLFQEHLGNAKIFDHYHKFYFSINLTNIEYGINKISTNLPTIKRHASDSQSLQNYASLLQEFGNLKETFNKISHKRPKRGLINILGSAVKFVTGNLDNDDLITINKNLETINKLQESEIAKISEITSFAAHITRRYEGDIAKINHNIDSTEKIVNKVISETEIIQALYSEQSSILKLHNFLKTIERTINLAKLEIPNLELFSRKELITIINYLRTLYKPEQIIHTSETHLFEVLDQSKILLLITNNAVTTVLKLPILKQQSYQYFSVYPLPNSKHQIIVPPASHYLEEDDQHRWASFCRRSRQYFICYDQLEDSCCPQRPTECDAADVINPYFAIIELENTTLLVSTKNKIEVIEKCDKEIQKQLIQNNNLIHSSCEVIIGNSTFQKPGRNLTLDIPVINNEANLESNQQQVKLKVEHLRDTKQLRADLIKLRESSRGRPLIQYAHASTTGITAVIILAICIAGCHYRKNLAKNICANRPIVTITELKKIIPKLDEDAQT